MYTPVYPPKYNRSPSSLKVPKVSVIIPTYNRFDSLLNAITSVRAQTYSNIEIIVINDGSSQKEYYETQIPNVTMIHLEKNSKQILGFACAAYSRNVGLKVATGEYIAFLDDDDIFLPNKITTQISKMTASGIHMSATESLRGCGHYVDGTSYPLYNRGAYWNYLSHIHGLTDDFPDIWDKSFLDIHNTIITSTVIISRKIIEKVGYMSHVNHGEDYDYWLRCLIHTDCLYIKVPLSYYDRRHTITGNYVYD